MTLSDPRIIQQATRELLSTYEFTHFITLATNNPMVKQLRMRGMLKAFDAHLSRYVAGPKWQRHPMRPFWFATLEKPDTHPHWHMLARIEKLPEDPEGLSSPQEHLELKIRVSWSKLCPTGSIAVRPDPNIGAQHYITKDLASWRAIELFEVSGGM